MEAEREEYFMPDVFTKARRSEVMSRIRERGLGLARRGAG